MEIPLGRHREDVGKRGEREDGCSWRSWFVVIEGSSSLPLEPLCILELSYSFSDPKSHVLSITHHVVQRDLLKCFGDYIEQFTKVSAICNDIILGPIYEALHVLM